MLINGSCHCGNISFAPRLAADPHGNSRARLRLLVLHQARRRVDVHAERGTEDQSERSRARHALRIRHAHCGVSRVLALRCRARRDERDRRTSLCRRQREHVRRSRRRRCCVARPRTSTAKARIRVSRAVRATGSDACSSWSGLDDERFASRLAVRAARDDVAVQSPKPYRSSRRRERQISAVQWMQVRVPDLGVMLIAIARPSGEGTVPDRDSPAWNPRLRARVRAARASAGERRQCLPSSHAGSAVAAAPVRAS